MSRTGGATRRSGRRLTRNLAIASALLMTTAALVAHSLGKATPISERRALEIFEQENNAAGPQELAPELRGESAAPEAPGSQGAASADRAPAAPRTATTASSGSGIDAPDRAATMPAALVPDEGVYAYRTKGSEEMSGRGLRSFPETTYRSVVHTGPRSWTEHHTFIEERQMLTALRFDGTTQVMDWTRQVVKFFGIDHGENLDFEPPIRLWWLPWEVGRAWNGTWTDVSDGKTSGTVRGATAGHGFLNIDGESVEVWIDELAVVAKGKISGVVEVRRWTAPKYGIAVREEITSDAEKGPLTYRSHWEVHLLSLKPKK